MNDESVLEGAVHGGIVGVFTGTFFGLLRSPGCFPEGTLVVLSDGRTKPIEQIEVGDEVLCDPTPETEGNETVGIVARVFVHEVDCILDLSLSIDGKCVTLTTTPEHRFYVPGRCEFIAAGELEPGVRFRTTEAGSEAVLVEKHLRETPATVYNFHVAVALDYFVKPCEDCPGILVHNRKWVGGGGNISASDVVGPPLEPENFRPGSGWSGAYDPLSGKVLVRPSGTSTVLKGGAVPEGIVPQYGGHAAVGAELSGILGSPEQGNVGFVLILQEDGSLLIRWRSGSLNYGFPNNEVPIELRPSIIEIVEKETGTPVRE